MDKNKIKICGFSNPKTEQEYRHKNENDNGNSEKIHIDLIHDKSLLELTI